MANALDILMERGFVEQISDEEGLRAALEKPITFYIGYDPTASSLHAGNLFTIMAMAHMQRNGHRPIALVGGGTGMIGDPSGRSEMRQMLSEGQIQANLESLKKQIGRYVDFGEGKALIVNNAEWLRSLNYIDFLRDIGRHFSVNRMLAAEAYRTRYESQEGLNFIEFNYQLLQSYDFLHLYREYGCTLQMGGNDQWGNILAGADLIRRVEGDEAYALTFPLLTTSSGAKMGKTAEGSVWLDADMLSPYEFYQFWINVADADVERFLKIYTFLPLEEIEQLASLEDAEIRGAKEVLAYEVTKLTHGEGEAEHAREASRALFGEKQISTLALTSAPTINFEWSAISTATDLFHAAELATSRSDARRLFSQGGAYVNDQPVSLDWKPDADGDYTLRRGKRRYVLARIRLVE